MVEAMKSTSYSLCLLVVYELQWDFTWKEHLGQENQFSGAISDRRLSLI